MYLHLKALHMIFVVSWFAGLFYIVRLMVYHAEADDKLQELRPQLELMQKRLWYGITWPSALLAMGFGASLLPHWNPIGERPWLVAKLALVALLFAYHIACGRLLTEQRQRSCRWTGKHLRLWNEVATLFLVAIVFLATLKHTLNAALGLAVMVALGMALWAGVAVYRRIRQS